MDDLLFLNSVVGDKGASVKPKHIMIQLHIIEACINDDIDLKYMSSQHIPSHMLSKLVPASIHQYLRQFINCQTQLITESVVSHDG